MTTRIQGQAYNMIGDACRYLIKSRRDIDTIFADAATSDAFILLWQAQSAIIEDCEIYDEAAIEFNLRTSGYGILKSGERSYRV